MSTNQTREQLAVVLAGGDPVTDLERLDADAILAENVVIKRADLAAVSYDPTSTTDTWVTHEECGPMSEAACLVRGSDDAWIMARHWVAIAEHLEAKEAREAEAAKEAKLTARRDALVDEVHARAYGFGGKVGRSTLVAIGMLMEAQDKLAEYEAQENAAVVAGAPSEPSP